MVEKVVGSALSTRAGLGSGASTFVVFAFLLS